MAFLNYEGTRPWAKSIKQAVLTKQMPPWFADPRYGHFANERKLSDADIKTVVAWVDAGAPEGNAKDMPAPLVWTEGWNIKPDLTFPTSETLHGPQGRHNSVHLFHRAQRPYQGHLGDGRRSSRRQPQRGASCQRLRPGRRVPLGSKTRPSVRLTFRPRVVRWARIRLGNRRPPGEDGKRMVRRLRAGHPAAALFRSRDRSREVDSRRVRHRV